MREIGALQSRRRRSGDPAAQLKLPLPDLIKKTDPDKLLCEKPETTQTASAEGKELLPRVLTSASKRDAQPGAEHGAQDGLARRVRKMEAMGTLASGIAHDFNNILTPILLRTEMALAGLQQDSPLRYQLEQVLTCGQRARDLVHQILNFSHQTGRERKPLQISLVVKEVLKLMRAALPATVEIRQDIAGSGMVLADLSLIHMLVMELCVKASEKMGDRGGVLEVSLRDLDVGSLESPPFEPIPEGPYVKLTVSHEANDAVIGASGQEPPYGEEEGNSASLIQSIVEQHDGRVVAPRKELKRRTFHIFLPRLEHRFSPEGAQAPRLPQGTERILLVDDEKEVMETFRQMLTYLGYSVFSTTSGFEALDVLCKAPDQFDLLITDQTMPKITGVRLASEVKRIRPDLPVLLCSGFGDAIQGEEARKAGLPEVVMKPLTASEIAHKVRQVLDRCKK